MVQEVGGSKPLGHPNRIPRSGVEHRLDPLGSRSPQAPLAQLAEQRTLNPQVLGSSPRGRTNESPGQAHSSGWLGLFSFSPRRAPWSHRGHMRSRGQSNHTHVVRRYAQLHPQVRPKREGGRPDERRTPPLRARCGQEGRRRHQDAVARAATPGRSEPVGQPAPTGAAATASRVAPRPARIVVGRSFIERLPARMATDPRRAWAVAHPGP